MINLGEVPSINFQFDGGAYQTIPFVFSGKDKQPIDLINRRIHVIIKEDKDLPDTTKIKRSFDITSNTNMFTLTLSTQDTADWEGQYLYFIVLTFPSNPNQYQLILKGTLNVERGPGIV